MNRTLQIILNIVACLVSLVFFTLLFFPLDSVINHILSNVEQQTKGQGDWRVSVSRIDASLIFDTQFEDFRLFQKNKEVFSAPRLSVDASLLSALAKKYNVHFEAQYPKGALSGHVVLTNGTNVDLGFDDFSLKELPYLNQMLTDAGYSLNLSGVANGSVSFSSGVGENQNGTNKGGGVSIEAVLDLKIKQAETEFLKVSAWGIDLPKMILSSDKEPLEINLEIGKNQILINRMSIPGPDLMLTLNGSLGLDRSQSVSKYSIDGRFGFSEEISKKIPLIAMIEKQKTSDGFYPLSIRGNSKKPEIQIGDFELSSFLQMMTAPPQPDAFEEAPDKPVPTE